MSFATLKTNNMAAFYAFEGETVAYTPLGGSQTNITAIVDREGPNQEPYVRGEIATGVSIRVQRSEVTTPKYGDIYNFDSMDWQHDTEGVVYKDADEFVIMLVRVETE